MQKTTIQTISDLELCNVTGGADKEGGSGGSSWLGSVWQGAKNQVKGVKDAWSEAGHNVAKGFFGPASKSLGL